MSLIDMANDLEYLSKDELISQANNPDGRYPVYLVLSEIKRRTDAEQAYMASMPAAQTTVAEETIKDFTGAASESPVHTNYAARHGLLPQCSSSNDTAYADYGCWWTNKKYG